MILIATAAAASTSVAPSTASLFALPLIASIAATSLIVALDRTSQAQLSPLDQLDPAPWQTSSEWLLEANAPIEEEFFLSSGSSQVSVATHSGGTWRTLRRHGSVQSVTAWDPQRNVPRHEAVGNEYLNERIHVICDDALNHAKAVLLSATDSKPKYSAIFVDVFGADNNVPPAFVDQGFVWGLHDVLVDDGVVIANFHRGSWAEDARLKSGIQAYTDVFGACISVPCRFQGNEIIAARKKCMTDTRSPLLDLKQANQFAMRRGWVFDPSSRLQRVKSHSKAR